MRQDFVPFQYRTGKNQPAYLIFNSNILNSLALYYFGAYCIIRRFDRQTNYQIVSDVPLHFYVAAPGLFVTYL